MCAFSCNGFYNSIFNWTVSNEIDFNFYETNCVSIYRILRPMVQEILCSALEILSLVSWFINMDLHADSAGNSVSLLLAQESLMKSWDLLAAFMAYLLSFGFFVEDEGAFTSSVLFMHLYSNH